MLVVDAGLLLLLLQALELYLEVVGFGTHRLSKNYISSHDLKNI